MGRGVAGALTPFGSHDLSATRADLLLDLQLWCWGRDIRSEQGNLLVRHGFARTAPPPDWGCPSLYRLDLPFGGRIVLRGFGVFYGEEGIGVVFIRRRTFRPLLGPRASWTLSPWFPETLPNLRDPDTKEEFERWSYLTGVLIRWIRLYESWVADHTPPGLRCRVVSEWAARGQPVIAPAYLPSAWAGVEAAFVARPDLFLGPGHLDRRVGRRRPPRPTPAATHGDALRVRVEGHREAPVAEAVDDESEDTRVLVGEDPPKALAARGGAT